VFLKDNVRNETMIAYLQKGARLMKRLLAVLVAVSALAAVGVSPSSASSPTVIRFFGCVYLHGGSVSVPAGTPVVLQAGWAAKTRGLIEDFLHTVTTTAALNGDPVTNADSLWTSPDPTTDAPYWSTWQFYPGGTLAAGQSVTLTLDWTVSHPYWDGVTLNPDGSHAVTAAGGSVTGGPVTCTVTGV
jgi:hypothetical protein